MTTAVRFEVSKASPWLGAEIAGVQFAGFLERVVADWMSALRDAQGPGTDPATARRTATLVIATIRGLLLDLLATGDRDRVQDAAESFLATLEQKARPPGAHGRAELPATQR